MDCSFLKCLSSNLLHVAHKRCNIIVEIKIAHCMLNSLLMLMFVRLEYTNVKRLKNMSKVSREGIWMNIMHCCLKSKLRIHMAAVLIYKEHFWRFIQSSICVQNDMI
jgi:hypothetical protein